MKYSFPSMGSIQPGGLSEEGDQIPEPAVQGTGEERKGESDRGCGADQAGSSLSTDAPMGGHEGAGRTSATDEQAAV